MYFLLSVYINFLWAGLGNNTINTFPSIKEKTWDFLDMNESVAYYRNHNQVTDRKWLRFVVI